MRKTIFSLMFAASLLVAIAGCSGSDDQASSKSNDKGSTTTAAPKSTTTSSIALQAGQIDITASPYCKDWAAIRGTKTPAYNNNPAHDDPLRKSYYTALVPKVEQLADDAPSEIKADVERSLELTREVARTGSSAPFETDEAKALQKRLATYAEKNCAK